LIDNKSKDFTKSFKKTAIFACNLKLGCEKF